MIGRVFRMVRTPITLLILLGILSYGAWWGWSNVLAPIPPAAPEPCVSQKIPEGVLTTEQVTINVFNGGDKKGLAGDVARAMRNRDFTVRQTDNTLEKVTATVIVGAAVDNPEVLLVKSFFKKAKVRADDRNDGTVDVLVGTKYGGFNKKAKREIRVESKSVCLPPGTSVSASAPTPPPTPTPTPTN